MSNDKFKPNKPIKGSNRAVLSIVLDPDAPSDRTLMVNGPFENGILFMGMLEMAKASFYEIRRQRSESESKQSERKIIIPEFVPPAN